VRPQVALLFRNHRDLLEEFTYFLPDAQAPAQVRAHALISWAPRYGHA
jgi:histone deacetylase complex regulatory component SIN3